MSKVGFKFSKKSKEKMSASTNKYYEEHPEAKEHLRKMNIGKKASPETKGEDPQDRIDLFTPIGFKTLVLWETEINNDINACIEKVRELS